MSCDVSCVEAISTAEADNCSMGLLVRRAMNHPAAAAITIPAKPNTKSQVRIPARASSMSVMSRPSCRAPPLGNETVSTR